MTSLQKLEKKKSNSWTITVINGVPRENGEVEDGEDDEEDPEDQGILMALSHILIH